VEIFRVDAGTGITAAERRAQHAGEICARVRSLPRLRQRRRLRPRHCLQLSRGRRSDTPPYADVEQLHADGARHLRPHHDAQLHPVRHPILLPVRRSQVSRAQHAGLCVVLHRARQPLGDGAHGVHLDHGGAVGVPLLDGASSGGRAGGHERCCGRLRPPHKPMDSAAGVRVVSRRPNSELSVAVHRHDRGSADERERKLDPDATQSLLARRKREQS